MAILTIYLPSIISPQLPIHVQRKMARSLVLISASLTTIRHSPVPVPTSWNWVLTSALAMVSFSTREYIRCTICCTTLCEAAAFPAAYLCKTLWMPQWPCRIASIRLCVCEYMPVKETKKERIRHLKVDFFFFVCFYCSDGLSMHWIVALWKLRASLFIHFVSLVFRAALSIIFRGNGMESPILSDAGISLRPSLLSHSLAKPIRLALSLVCLSFFSPSFFLSII